MASFKLNILVCIFLIHVLTFYDLFVESQIETLKKRVGLIESCLREDIALLREEFEIELKELKNTQMSTVGNFTDVVKANGSTNQSEHLSLLENVETDMLTKIAQLQDGFHSEKVWRRDVQHQLQDGQQKIEDVVHVLTNIVDKITTHLGEITFNKIDRKISEILAEMKENKVDTVEKPALDCADLYRRGHVTSGVYEVYPSAMWRPIHVYCDMETDGGGWTVFQRRCDGSENFKRSWKDYTYGFGNMSAEFWLGNEYVFRLTSQIPQELRIELEDFENDRRFAKYSSFEIAPGSELYKLTVGGFTGNVTDSLISDRHNNQQFSTFDKGPSAGCAETYKGGFWYNKCHYVNINGLYLKGKHESYADGVNWHGFKGHHYSLKFTEMKFRSK